MLAEKSVAQKAHVKPGTTVSAVNPVPGVVESLGLPEDVTFVEPAAAQLLLVFVRDRAELQRLVPPAVEELGPASAIWVFYRKGSKAVGLDMSRDDVWALAETLGLRPLGIVSVDETWSAFRLRRGPS